MFHDDEDDSRTYKVVINHEEQYSIWPHDRDNPLGWRDEGMVGKRKECLDHIDQVWTDMRPLSLRIQMEEMQRNGANQPAAAARTADEDESSALPDLVTRLSTGIHRVSATRYKSTDDFRQTVTQGFVLVKFTGTRGGTELGFKIDKEKSTLDFEDPSKKVRLVGRLTLNGVPVECTAEIDPETREGTGALTSLAAPADPPETEAPPVKVDSQPKKRSKKSLQRSLQ
jgi:uncharacterized protein YbdZ (MbtH family)